MGYLHPSARAAAHFQDFVDALQQPTALIPDMGDIHTVVVGHRASQQCHFVHIGKRAGRILQARRETESTVLHGFGYLSDHLVHGLAGSPDIVLPDNAGPQRTMSEKDTYVDGGRVCIQIRQERTDIAH